MGDRGGWQESAGRRQAASLCLYGESSRQRVQKEGLICCVCIPLPPTQRWPRGASQAHSSVLAVLSPHFWFGLLARARRAYANGIPRLQKRLSSIWKFHTHTPGTCAPVVRPPGGDLGSH